MDGSFFDDIEQINFTEFGNEIESEECIYDSDSDNEKKKKEYKTLLASQIQNLSNKEGVFIIRTFDNNFYEIKSKKKITTIPSIIALYKFKEKNAYFTKKTLKIMFPLLWNQNSKKLDSYMSKFSFLSFK